MANPLIQMTRMTATITIMNLRKTIRMRIKIVILLLILRQALQAQLPQQLKTKFLYQLQTMKTVSSFYLISIIILILNLLLLVLLWNYGLLIGILVYDSIIFIYKKTTTNFLLYICNWNLYFEIYTFFFTNFCFMIFCLKKF